MKKEEKIAVISNAILSVDICRCYFQYDQNYFYYYPNAVNERFLLGQEEDDFAPNYVSDADLGESVAEGDILADGFTEEEFDDDDDFADDEDIDSYVFDGNEDAYDDEE